MHEFETFMYLDVQKTGSTFISNLLAEFSSEEVQKYRKHGRVEVRYDPKKFYFITVRNPFDQYVSLYSHGCAGMGGLARRLRKRGRGDLYDSTWEGFRHWLKFILKPEISPLLDDEYGAARNAGGRVEEGFGRVTGDAKSQVQGVIDQAQGTAENLYGQAKDAASNAAEGVRKTASSFEDVVRRTIEDRPYTAVAIALALGWLFGRTHRPL